MNIANFRIEPADYRADFNELRALRHAVFVEEQNIPVDIEFDEIDSECRHFIARNDLNEAVGTGRLTPGHQIGRMAVLKEWRHQGVGKALLEALLNKAINLGWTEISLNAQVTVLGFYEKYGFIKSGDIFPKAGIAHQTMRIMLQPAIAPVRLGIKPLPESINATELNSLDDVCNATAQLIRQARRQICIYSRDLEHALYGRGEIVEALKQFAISGRDGCVYITVQNTLATRGRSHPLVTLAQRLPSSFLFRSPVEPEDLQYPSVFIVNDSGGYLFRLLGDRYNAIWSPALPARSRQLLEIFESSWQRSLPCSEFKVLGL